MDDKHVLAEIFQKLGYDVTVNTNLIIDVVISISNDYFPFYARIIDDSIRLESYYSSDNIHLDPEYHFVELADPDLLDRLHVILSRPTKKNYGLPVRNFNTRD